MYYRYKMTVRFVSVETADVVGIRSLIDHGGFDIRQSFRCSVLNFIATADPGDQTGYESCPETASLWIPLDLDDTSFEALDSFATDSGATASDIAVTALRAAIWATAL